MSDSKPNLALPVIAGVVATALGVGIWAVMYMIINTSAYWLAGPVCGVAVGMSMRVANQSRDRRAQPIAAALTFFACWLGYATVYVTLAKFMDPTYQPTFGDGLKNFFQWMNMVIFTALGCYFAYILARQNPSATAPE